MERKPGAENRGERLLLFTLITASLFIPSGCLQREVAHSLERRQPPAAIGSASPPPAAEKGRAIQHIDDGGEFCEKYLLKKAAGEMAEGNRVVKLRAFNAAAKTLSPDLKTWLAKIDDEKLAAYEIRSDDKTALLLRSTNPGAAGIASNFQHWYLQLDNYSINVQSLSENPALFFLGKDGLLNYYSVDYGEKFLEDRDWDNLTLNLNRYRVGPDGTAQTISEERDVKCR